MCLHTGTLSIVPEIFVKLASEMCVKIILIMLKRLVLPFVMVSAAFAVEWLPIDPAQLAAKTPKIEASADAEVLYWEVRIRDVFSGSDIRTEYDHYLRVKVYNAKGVQDQSTVEVPFVKGTTISDLNARTIRPDGSIVEAKGEAIRETDILKGKKVRTVRVKSVAFPSVEPGSIIEYRYRATHMNQVANYVHLEFSRDLPVHKVRYFLKPLDLAWLPYGMRAMDFNSGAVPFREEQTVNGKFYVTEANNIPAYRSEAQMPPEDEVRPWMLVYYEQDRKLTPERFWDSVGKGADRVFSQMADPDKAARQMAATLTANATTDEEKLGALLTFCRTEIRNIESSSSGLTLAERQKAKENHSAGDILKQKMGSSEDIQALFAAMAKALKFDARLAMIADRREKIFHPQYMTTHFLNATAIAVNLNGQWKYYDPTTPRLPGQFIPWYKEGATALLSDSKKPELVSTPISEPELSRVTRTATAEIRANGILEADVELSFSGHQATERRNALFAETDQEVEQDAREYLKGVLGGAEIATLTVENLKDTSKPLLVKAKISIPGYAARTSTRLFVKPALFQRGAAPRFSASTRKYPVFFSYPWSESDSVTIQVPDGMEVDAAVRPTALTLSELGNYNTAAAFTGRKLKFTRELVFGKGGKVMFPQEAFSALKNIFDRIHQGDDIVIGFKSF